MPTTNPRVNVTLPPSLYALVGQLAKHQRVSRSTVLREFLEAVEPQLRQAVALMDAANRVTAETRANLARDMEAGIKDAEKAANVALQKAAGVTRDLVDAAEVIRGRRPALRAISAPRDAAESAGGGASKRTKRPADPPVSKRGVKS